MLTIHFPKSFCCLSSVLRDFKILMYDGQRCRFGKARNFKYIMCGNRHFSDRELANRRKNCGGSAHYILEIAKAVLAVPERLVTFVQKNSKSLRMLIWRSATSDLAKGVSLSHGKPSLSWPGRRKTKGKSRKGICQKGNSRRGCFSGEDTEESPKFLNNKPSCSS